MPERDHDRVAEGGCRGDRERRSDAGGGDEHAGDRRAERARDVDADRVERRGGGYLVARDEFGNERLVCGRSERRACAEQEDEQQQERGRHQVGEGERGQHRSECGHGQPAR